MTVLAIVVSVVLGSQVAAAQDLYARAESLAFSRHFAEAEAEYRRQLAAHPDDRRLRLGFARVVLWSGRYKEAERLFRDLGDDPAALLGYAQAAYWSGDARAAEKRFRDVIRRDPQNAEARQALSELAQTRASRYEIRGMTADDTQPLRRNAVRATASFASDALTRLSIRGASGEIGGKRMQSFGGGASTSFPPLRLTLTANVERFSFPDGAAKAVGDIAASWRIAGQQALTLTMDRTPLVATAASLGTHATATRYNLRWSRGDYAGANVFSVDYSDRNSGSGADAYALLPLRKPIRAGVSAAWRDTNENRFRLAGFTSTSVAPGMYSYGYSGVYDPYWTPHDLREVRAIVLAELKYVKLQADAGWARDRYLGFGPATGPSPVPFFAFPVMLERTFHPWRAMAEVTWPVGRGIELRGRFRHEVTAFYRVNEFEASVGGRL